MGRRTLFVVAACASLAAAACGSSGSSSSAGGSGGAAPSFNGTLKFGVLVTLSGTAASIGTDQQTGIEMAAAELNANGGILGKQVVIDVQDDGGTATTGVQGARKLVQQDGVQALFGPTLSATTLGVLPITTPANVFEMGTAVVADAGDATKWPNWYRMAPPAALQASTFVQYMQQKGYTKAAILAVNSPLGTSNIDAFTAAIKGTNISITASQTHETGTVDLSPQMQKLKDSSPDLVLVFNTANPDQIAAVKARNTLSWSVPMLGFSTMHDPLVTQAVGAGGMDNVLAGQSYVRLTEGQAPKATTDWLARLRTYLKQDKLTRDVSQIAVGYDGLMMFADAASKTNSTDASALRGFREQNPYSGVSSMYKYDSTRHDGITVSDLAFVVASYFNDGLYKTA